MKRMTAKTRRVLFQVKLFTAALSAQRVVHVTSFFTHEVDYLELFLSFSHTIKSQKGSLSNVISEKVSLLNTKIEAS